MTRPSAFDKAVRIVENRGVLLVFPIENRKDIPSLWAELHPRKPMRWEWDETGDDDLSRLWHLRAELAESKRVLYAKWFRGRATLFSAEVFTALLALVGARLDPRASLSQDARRLLEVLEMDSPLSTKQLKQIAGFQGRFQETAWNRATRELWSRLLMVIVGEVEDSSFPSLSIGATRLLFEDLWSEARALTAENAERIVQQKLGADSVFFNFLKKLRS